jgi:hypothetical protein
MTRQCCAWTKKRLHTYVTVSHNLPMVWGDLPIREAHGDLCRQNLCRGVGRMWCQFVKPGLLKSKTAVCLRSIN